MAYNAQLLFTKTHKKKVKLFLKKAPLPLGLSHTLYFVALSPIRVTAKRLFLIQEQLVLWSKKMGKVLLLPRTFVNITKKKEKSRMGGGSGPVAHLVAYIAPGQPLFQIEGLSKLSTAHLANKCRSSFCKKFVLKGFF